MQLKQYLAAWWRWSWAILLVAAICGVGGYEVSHRLPPLYQASTKVLLPPANAANAKNLNSVFSGSTGPLTVSDLLISNAVLNDVISNLKLNMKPEALAALVNIKSERDTPILVVTASNRDPGLAAQMANEIINVFNTQTRTLGDSARKQTILNLDRELGYTTNDIARTQERLDTLAMDQTPSALSERTRLQAQLQTFQKTSQTLLENLNDARISEMQSSDVLAVVDAAKPPVSPVSPRPSLTAILASAIGALVVAGAVALKAAFSDSVRTAEDVERLAGLRTIAKIPREKRGEPMLDPGPYWQLAAKIDLSLKPGANRSITIAAASQAENTANAAAYLAAALSEFGRHVVVVDADLGNPLLQQIFGASNDFGVTTAIAQSDVNSITNHLQRTRYKNLMLLTSGPSAANPDGIIRSLDIQKLFNGLQCDYDCIVFRGPPLDASADGLRLANSCDFTVLLADSSVTSGKTLIEATHQLTEAGANLLGVVLTGVRIRSRGTKRMTPPRDTRSSRRLPLLKLHHDLAHTRLGTSLLATRASASRRTSAAIHAIFQFRSSWRRRPRKSGSLMPSPARTSRQARHHVASSYPKSNAR